MEHAHLIIMAENAELLQRMADTTDLLSYLEIFEKATFVTHSAIPFIIARVSPEHDETSTGGQAILENMAYDLTAWAQTNYPRAKFTVLFSTSSAMVNVVLDGQTHLFSGQEKMINWEEYDDNA